MKPPWKEGDSTRMFTPMETRLVAVLALLSCVSPAAAQRAASSPPPPPPPGWSAIVRTFDAFAAGDSVVGGSVLVLRDGRVLAHHEYGFADRALGQRVDERTIFHWASITKTLTAVAVMQLRDRGRLSLDDRMTRSYFGATPYHLAAARANNYTLLRDSAGRVSLVANGRDFDPGITIPNGGWNAPLGDVAR